MPDLSNGADSGNNSLRGGKKADTRGALEGNWTEDRCNPKAGRGSFTTRRFVTVLDEAMRVDGRALEAPGFYKWASAARAALAPACVEIKQLRSVDGVWAPKI